MRGVALAILLLLASAVAAHTADRPIVVELFTSQGCSSCPPAEALLNELAPRRDVLALAFHVDYWDGLGWKDPYSDPAATARQRRYAAQFRLATIYTPQAVVDGGWQGIGSDRAEIEQALDAAARAHRGVPILLTVEHGRARLGVDPGPQTPPAALFLVGFDRIRQTKVRGGENAGRMLAEADVVRGIERVRGYDGKPAQIEAPVPWACDRVAALLQRADGRVIGVAVADPGAR